MNSIAFPILLPLLFVVILLLVRSRRLSGYLAVLGTTVLFFVSVYIFIHLSKQDVLVLQLGAWKAPYGITLVVDYLSAIMLVVSSIVALSIAIYSLNNLNRSFRYNKFYVFFFSLLMGVNGSFITGDVFNLYVWFEVMLISSFVLITMGVKKEQLEGGIKYLSLNLIGSLLFLAGLGLLYGKTGTLNMAHLADILSHDEESILMNTSAALFFIAFGIKAAIFPLFFWLPSSYHTADITISALFAGLLTKVGVYAFIRFFTLFFIQDQVFWHNLLLVVAGFTMIIGGMAASIHYDTRRILSYHIISQIGYMIMGLGIFTPLAIAGALFFMIHNMIAKTNTFLLSGTIAKIKGTFHLKETGGLLKSHPLLAVLFFIPAFSLAGFPPLSGFIAKFTLVKSGIDSGQYLVTIIAVFTGLLTLYSMIKIWFEAFLKKQPENNTNAHVLVRSVSFTDYLPSAILASITVLLGVFGGSVFHYMNKAAEQLINNESYLKSVLNY